jgi:hypothetical protein
MAPARHQGIIAAAEVVSDFRATASKESRHRYVEPAEMNWGWEAGATVIARGFVPRDSVNEVLGYSPGHVFMGFNQGSGYKRIAADAYSTLFDLLKQGATGLKILKPIASGCSWRELLTAF